MEKKLYLVGVSQGAPVSVLGPYQESELRPLMTGRRQLEDAGADEGVYRARALSAEEALAQVERDLREGN